MVTSKVKTMLFNYTVLLTLLMMLCALSLVQYGQGVPDKTSYNQQNFRVIKVILTNSEENNFYSILPHKEL